jgi:hypothetical protein
MPGDPFGQIVPPEPFASKYGSLEAKGLTKFLNNVLRLMVAVAGIYAFLNLIIAGYGFMSAGGDPKAVASAWAKIWKSLIGLLIIAGSFVLAAIFGQLLFGEWDAILQPAIYGPD